MSEKELNKNVTSENEEQKSTTVDKTDANKPEKVVATEDNLSSTEKKEEKPKEKPTPKPEEDKPKEEIKDIKNPENTSEEKVEKQLAKETQGEKPEKEEVETTVSKNKAIDEDDEQESEVNKNKNSASDEDAKNEKQDSVKAKNDKSSSTDDADDADEDEEDEDVNYNEFSLEELVEKLNELIQKEDVLKIKNRVSKIRIAFDSQIKSLKQQEEDKFNSDEEAEGDFEFEYPEIHKHFYEVFNNYKEKNAQYKEKLEKEKQENLTKKNNILEKLEDLLASGESLKTIYDKFQELQEDWKNIGMIPKDKTDEVWNRYHFLIGKFFEKVQMGKELRDLDMQKNLETKIKIAEKTEDLLLEKSVNKSFKKLQDYHREWKELGPAPKGKEEELWERFKTATDKIHERRKEFYQEVERKQKDNLLLKTDLCEKIEAIPRDHSSIKDWNTATKQVQDLFTEWRKIGPVPQKHNDSIWDRFKGNMNEFYSLKKEYFKDIKDERQENLNKKIALCEKAESLKVSTDWKNTKFELINLQKEWKKIGAVPRKDSDSIWKRFRAANDEFFNRMEENFKSKNEEELNNLKAKEELVEKIKTFEFGDDNKANLEKIKEFQKEWIKIGFVPRNKHKKIQKDYRDAIDKQLESLKINPAELQNMQIKSKIDSAKDDKDAEKVAREEIKPVKNKIKALKADILQWENNLSFFSNSKNADVLTKEVVEKINKAKKEVETLQAKVRFIDSYSKKNK